MPFSHPERYCILCWLCLGYLEIFPWYYILELSKHYVILGNISLEKERLWRNLEDLPSALDKHFIYKYFWRFHFILLHYKIEFQILPVVLGKRQFHIILCHQSISPFDYNINKTKYFKLRLDKLKPDGH